MAGAETLYLRPGLGPSSSLISWVTLGRSLHLSEPQFPHLKLGWQMVTSVHDGDQMKICKQGPS